MIIGILSDTHIGYPRFYEDSIAQTRQAFQEACDRSDLVLIAGDIFDTKTPKFEVLAKAMEILSYGKEVDWDSKQIKGERGEHPIVAIHGTHDRRSKEMINPVQLLEGARLITNTSDKTVTFTKTNPDGTAERIAIHGVGGTTDDTIRQVIKELDFKPIPDAFNILMLHQTITDVIPMADGISLEELPPGFDLYLCGHIHKKMVIEKNGKRLLIPGSTVITQLKKEEEEPRAYVLLDTKTNEIRFVDLKSRPFHYGEIQVNQQDSTYVLTELRKKIDSMLKENEEMPIIRVMVKGTLKQGIKKENLSFQDVYKDYEERCMLQIDNELDEQGLKEKLESLRKMYEQKLSVREIGIESIKKKLSGTDAKDMDIEFLMSMLQDDNNIDIVVEEMMKKKQERKENSIS